MARRGFQDVLNGSANGAGIVLPESQTADYAIDEIGKNGLLNQQNYLRKKAYDAQTNKDFSANALKLPPGLQYQTELNGLAQKWYDKGVQYRKQGFDPFNADYSRPDQANAAQEYMAEKQHIENLSDLQKGVDADYKTKSAASQEGKLDGFDEYQQALQGHTLQSLYKAGGINALPNMYKRLDLNDVDKDVNIKPQTREVDEPVPGQPGVTNTVTQHYVNIPQAAKSWEQNFLNKPGASQFLQKSGIGQPKDLFTANGRNMLRDPNNPEDFGHIDEPGIYHQMTAAYLTDPHLIKQLPAEVKQRIVATQPFKQPEPWVGGNFNASTAAANIGGKAPYQPTQDPDFQKFIDNKFEQQIGKERQYQGVLMDGVARKLQGVDLGSTSKMDATLANLAMRKEGLRQGWTRIGISKDNLALSREKWASKMTDSNTREQWIQDIQKMNPDAVTSLKAAVSEIGGSVLTMNHGFKVILPEMGPNVKDNGMVDAVNPKKMNQKVYDLSKYSGRSGRMIIEQVLNKLPSVGKAKVLKDEPYAPDYNGLGGGANAVVPNEKDTADDL